MEYFREIAATGSINEAARRLNMSQPPLSYQMKQLEAELHVKLFERKRTGVTLTKAGQLLYERTENLLAFVRSTENEVAKAGKSRSSVSGSRRLRSVRSCRVSPPFPEKILT